MKTIKFHKTTCGVELLLNVGNARDIQQDVLPGETYNTDFFEILFIKNAGGSLTLNQNRITIGANMLIFISPFQKQMWQLDDKDRDFRWLVFQEDFLNEFFADKLFTYRLLFFYQLNFPLFYQVSDYDMAAITTELAAIKEELLQPRADSDHMVRAMLYSLLLRLNRQYADTYRLPVERPANNFAFQFKKLLEQHIKTLQRIEDYTKMLGISRISLNKATQAQFNMSASQLIKQRLLFEVKNMLLHSNLNISEIAEALNFPEPNHLMRFFKKLTGLTTSQFMASYQNGSF